jgi:hypothetical protein
MDAAVFSPGKSGREVKLANDLYVVPKLRSGQLYK